MLTRSPAELAPRSLVTLQRRTLARSWGVRAARIYAALVAIGITATMWIVAYRYGPDDTAVSLVGRAAALVAWIAGGMSALALAAPPKDAALTQGIAALASARGHSDETFARADLVATVRILAEVIVVPIVLVGLFLFLVIAGGRIEGAAWPIAGSIIFGLVASIVLGVVAWGCRHWGGPQGRTWLIVIVVLPWVLAEQLLSARTAAYVSIPGLLGRAWEALTGVTT
ncbi:MAG TPA: hypothetical protein VF881_16975 [Polyangiaceae bacterium]